jgi:hypothetical protein
VTASREDIAWAKKALTDGRSMAYVASVLEMSERKTRSAVFGLGRDAQREFRAKIEGFAEIADREDNPRGPGRPKQDDVPRLRRTAGDTDKPPERRRALLRRRFARHWDMIWFLRRCGMAGRTLRRIYGAECLIWSVGGGIDAALEEQ